MLSGFHPQGSRRRKTRNAMTQPSQGGAITADGASAPISEDVAITSKNHSLPRRAASAVKSIASKLLTLELCILVLLAAVVFGPQLFGIQTYGILTGSMEPAIQTGALTFVDTGVSGADLRPGDVAAFDIGEGRICTHRVVSVDPENQTITATGYGIQSEGLPDIETAWDAYKKQNGIGDGEPDKRIVSAVTAGTLLKFVEGVPEVGDEVDGKTIEEVVPDIEHLEPQDVTPLTSTPETITYVDGTTPTAPENTVNWFKDMSKVEEMDIFGITVAEDAAVDGMFDGTTALKKVHVNDSSKIVQALPEGFEQTVPGGVYEPAGNYEFWMTRKDGYIIKPQEIIAAANDISKNGTTSQYYAEYHDYLVNGGDWDPVSNEPGSTFGQALEDGYGLMHILWGDGREYTARIIGMIHDERADGAGKAGLTFQFTGLLYDPQRFNPKVSNFGGWRDSELRFRMNPTELGNESVLMSGANNDHLVWNSVPRSLQSAITTVSKLTKNRDDGTSTTAEMNKIPETSTTDKLWLISQYELCSDNNGRTTQNEGLQYEKYKAMTKWDSIYSHPMLKKFEAKKNLNSPKPDTSRLWWLRTMNNEDTYEFVCSINNGYSYNSNYATYLRFIAPCFCI